MVVTPWCDAKSHDGHSRSDTYCTCSKTPGHTDAHKCWGCGREWPNEPVLIVIEERSEISPDAFRRSVQ